MSAENIHICCRSLDLNMLEKLLQLGADPNVIDSKGRTPLHTILDHHARYNRNYDVKLLSKFVELLIKAGCDVNANRVCNEERYTYGSYGTPLHIAAYNNHTNVVRLLIGAGADVNSLDSTFKWAPLHMSVMAGNTEISCMLVKAGADISLTDRRELTAEFARLHRQGSNSYDVITHLSYNELIEGQRIRWTRWCRPILFDICMGLEGLNLPALLTVIIFDNIIQYDDFKIPVKDVKEMTGQEYTLYSKELQKCRYTLPMYLKWNVVCAVKHFLSLETKK